MDLHLYNYIACTCIVFNTREALYGICTMLTLPLLETHLKPMLSPNKIKLLSLAPRFDFWQMYATAHNFYSVPNFLGRSVSPQNVLCSRVFQYGASRESGGCGLCGGLNPQCWGTQDRVFLSNSTRQGEEREETHKYMFNSVRCTCTCTLHEWKWNRFICKPRSNESSLIWGISPITSRSTIHVLVYLRSMQVCWEVGDPNL